MVFFTAGFGLLFFILFWGAGLALLVTPRAWRAAWPALCAPAGLALQSAVVWIGAHTSWSGAESYGRWSLVLPAVLLVAGLWRAQIAEGRRVLREVANGWAVAALTAGVLSLLVLPFSYSSPVLTTSSMGSCDAGDYTAGARALLEFARQDRSGFMGLTEVVRLYSVDNFFDHWLRLNHFTPSALIALHSAVLGYRPHELVSLMTALLVALSVPTVYWLARSTLRYGEVPSLWVAGVYGCSPLLMYAVYHVAMSQLIAAIAIALLTGAAIALWRAGATWRAGVRWWGVLAIAYWLILGAYNFIVVVCLVPAAAYVGYCVITTREWARLGRWILLVLAPLAVVAVFALDRTLGLVERFVLFQQYDFGWRIPGLTPEGWFGLVGSLSLSPLPTAIRWLLAAGVVGFFVGALCSAPPRWRRGGILALAFTLPILAGYGYLLARGLVRQTNASYDAYKLFCVFYPGILAGLSFWWTWTRSPHRILRGLAIVLAVTIAGVELWAGSKFVRQMKKPALLVDAPLAGLQRLESVPEVGSVNLLIDDFWGRLYANAFLLRKPQYFPTHTYEGRLNTALKGDWDIGGPILAVATPDAPGGIDYGRMRPYSLAAAKGRYALRVRWGLGWYDPERRARKGEHWRWSGAAANLVVENPHSRPLSVGFRMSVRSVIPRDLQFWIGGREIGRVQVGPELREIVVPAVQLPPGESVLDLRSDVPAISPGPSDGRLLGCAVYRWEFNVLPEPAEVRG